MQFFSASPTSRLQIRNITKYIRSCFNLQNVERFPVIEFLEIMFPKLIEGFVYEYVEPSVLGDKEGETIPSLNLIRIRLDVYEKAVAGNARARFTIMHEIGHLLMHDNANIALCRTAMLKPYEDPEWQANTFAGEILMDSDVIANMSIEEIAKKCQTSLSAAKVQYSAIHR